MTSPVLSLGFLAWGAIMLLGGGWAMYAGHRDRQTAAAAGEETGGVGGYVLGGLFLLLGAGVAAMGFATLL